MQASAEFETMFDLSSVGWQHGPMLAIGTVVLAGALGLLLWRRRRHKSTLLPGFLMVVGLVLQIVAVLAWWETSLLLADLRSSRTEVVQGTVQSHEVKRLASWNSTSKRHDHSTWEAFLVGELAFGFARGGRAVGFTNAGTPLVELRNGDLLRVHYLEQTPGDFASRRILKLERALPQAGR